MSRIDYIWLSENIISHTLGYYKEEVDHISNFNHSFITVQIESDIFLREHIQQQATPKRKIYDFKKVSDSVWEEYKQLAKMILDHRLLLNTIENKYYNIKKNIKYINNFVSDNKVSIQS